MPLRRLQKRSRHTDPSDHLVSCGHSAFFSAHLQCLALPDGVTGFHTSLGPDCALKNVEYWVKQDGTTAKAASSAPPPMPWSNSVQELTQHFEQMSMRNTANPVDMGHIPDDAMLHRSHLSGL